jgi:hypothetical protein
MPDAAKRIWAVISDGVPAGGSSGAGAGAGTTVGEGTDGSSDDTGTDTAADVEVDSGGCGVSATLSAEEALRERAVRDAAQRCSTYMFKLLMCRNDHAGS